MTEQAPAMPTTGKRILVIEPSSGLCEMLAFALRSQGHSVTYVPDAGAGLRHLTTPGTEIPDLVILALQPASWPQRDLLNLLAFGRLYHRVAIVLLTMPDHRLQLPCYLSMRPIARLDKPFRVEQLLHLVVTLPVANVPERSGRHG
ncbi:MAG TPA: response regulator [Ktedonobacteraceae bacterium]|nr:response regulator [Ktedonobacteraceae bacterium]